MAEILATFGMHPAPPFDIVIAEDNRMLREVLVKRSRESGHRIVCETGFGDVALDACRSHHPDILLLDMVLNTSSGGAVLEDLEAEGSSVKVIVISCHLEDYLVFRLEQSRLVQGYIDKRTDIVDSLPEALCSISEGKRHFSQTFICASRNRKADPCAFDKILTFREKEYLRFVVHGMSDTEIADQLGISVRTAEGRRSMILHKLGIGGTAKLITYARNKGFDLFPAGQLHPAPVLEEPARFAQAPQAVVDGALAGVFGIRPGASSKTKG